MKNRAVEALNEDLNVMEVTILLNDAGERSSARALTILRYLRQNAEVLHCKPAMDPNDPTMVFRGSLQILIATDREVDQLRELALAEEVEKSTFAPIALDGLELVTTEEAQRRSKQRQEAAGKVVRSSSSSSGVSKGKLATVRVTVDRLDHLMNLVAELVISKTQLQQLVLRYHRGSEADQLLQRLVEVNGRLSRLTTELQEGIMKARMVQIGQVFFRFNRLVRDLSKNLGKNVEFLIEGTETELDKTVIDEIGDPLMHLIRNALDHGIEAPEIRQKKGKPPKGILLLKASHAGDHIVVETADDGKGMDVEQIRASAVRKGVLTEYEARKLSSAEVFNLIFAPGFSTAEEVTSVSGRGVGMDVVKTTIEGLGGEIQVKSEVNVGTSIQIKLPLTLAIIQGLLIWVGEECFAVPLSTVKETIQLNEDAIHNFNGYPAMVFRGEMITLIFLDEFFEIPRVPRKKRFVVFAGVDEERVGLIVDSLIGRREIVIKSLDKTFMDVRGFAGATVLGDGQVSLILDVPALMDQSREARDSLRIHGT
jgi:two-component system chemotaxis sensor kinase CheA